MVPMVSLVRAAAMVSMAKEVLEEMDSVEVKEEDDLVVVAKEENLVAVLAVAVVEKDIQMLEKMEEAVTEEILIFPASVAKEVRTAAVQMTASAAVTVLVKAVA